MGSSAAGSRARLNLVRPHALTVTIRSGCTFSASSLIGSMLCVPSASVPRRAIRRARSRARTARPRSSRASPRRRNAGQAAPELRYRCGRLSVITRLLVVPRVSGQVLRNAVDVVHLAQQRQVIALSTAPRWNRSVFIQSPFRFGSRGRTGGSTGPATASCLRGPVTLVVERLAVLEDRVPRPATTLHVQRAGPADIQGRRTRVADSCRALLRSRVVPALRPAGLGGLGVVAAHRIATWLRIIPPASRMSWSSPRGHPGSA